MEKKILRIMLDIWAGPIWGYEYDETFKKYTCGIDVLDNDSELIKLHNEIQNLYSSYYHINYKDMPVYFDFEQEKNDKEKMLALLFKLNKRLKELNDGSFTVEDLETERVKNL